MAQTGNAYISPAKTKAVLATMAAVVSDCGGHASVHGQEEWVAEASKLKASHDHCTREEFKAMRDAVLEGAKAMALELDPRIAELMGALSIEELRVCGEPTLEEMKQEID